MMSQKDKYIGVAISNFPKELAKHELVSFLNAEGLSHGTNEDMIDINSTKNGVNVTVTPLDTETVQNLVKKIDFSESRTKFFQRPLYCRALLEMSPSKPDNPVVDDKAVIGEKPHIKVGRGDKDNKLEESQYKSCSDYSEYDFDNDTTTETPIGRSKFFKGDTEDNTAHEDSETESEDKNNFLKQKKSKKKNKAAE